MAQTPKKWDLEPWLKHLKNGTMSHGSNSIIYWTLSHGSNPSIIGPWAMAQTSKLLDFEPWLKLINYWTLSHGSDTSEKFSSHGSNPHFLGVWAMAQTHIWHADFHMHGHGKFRKSPFSTLVTWSKPTCSYVDTKFWKQFSKVINFICSCWPSFAYFWCIFPRQIYFGMNEAFPRLLAAPCKNDFEDIRSKK